MIVKLIGELLEMKKIKLIYIASWRQATAYFARVEDSVPDCKFIYMDDFFFLFTYSEMLEENDCHPQKVTRTLFVFIRDCIDEGWYRIEHNESVRCK